MSTEPQFIGKGVNIVFNDVGLKEPGTGRRIKVRGEVAITASIADSLPVGLLDGVRSVTLSTDKTDVQISMLRRKDKGAPMVIEHATIAAGITIDGASTGKREPVLVVYLFMPFTSSVWKWFGDNLTLDIVASFKTLMSEQQDFVTQVEDAEKKAASKGAPKKPAPRKRAAKKGGAKK